MIERDPTKPNTKYKTASSKSQGERKEGKRD
jgi:hypothetical protein